MSDRDEMDPQTVRLIFYRLVAITSAVIVSPPKGHAWFGWILDGMWGYFQTEHNLYHPCGEDYSKWREDAAAKGIEHRTFETTRDREQRELYAERMGPVVAQRMLDAMQQPEKP